VLEALDRATQEETQGIHRILLSVDGSANDWPALDRAIELAVEHSALLSIVAVIPDPKLYTGFGMMVLPCSPDTLKRDADTAVTALSTHFRATMHLVELAAPGTSKVGGTI